MKCCSFNVCYKLGELNTNFQVYILAVEACIVIVYLATDRSLASFLAIYCVDSVEWVTPASESELRITDRESESCSLRHSPHREYGSCSLRHSAHRVYWSCRLRHSPHRESESCRLRHSPQNYLVNIFLTYLHFLPGSSFCANCIAYAVDVVNNCCINAAYLRLPKCSVALWFPRLWTTVWGITVAFVY